MRNRELVIKVKQGTKTTQTSGEYGVSHKVVRLNTTSLAVQEAVEEVVEVEIPKFAQKVERPKVVYINPNHTQQEPKQKGYKLTKAQELGIRFMKASSGFGVLFGMMLPVLLQVFGDFKGLEFVSMVVSCIIATPIVFSIVGCIPFLLATLLRNLFE